MAILIATSGPAEGQQYELIHAETTLGRQPTCHVVIDVGAVSREHARVCREGDRFFLLDLGSRNGTFLNEKRLAGRHQLNNGDEFKVCDVSFRFHSDSSSAGAPSLDAGLQTVEVGSGFAAVMVDDESGSQSTIMSKLDVSSSMRGVQLTATPEAKLAALLEITQGLGGAISLDKVFPQVFASMFKIFVQADRGFIVMKNEEGVLVPRWTQARRGNEDTIRISRTIVNQVIDTKEAILSADAATDSRFEMSQSIADFRIRSMMCAPLVDTSGKAFGALQIDTLDQRSRFQAEDLEVLASVAAQVGFAIDHAQMHEQALEQKELERDLKLAHQVQAGFLPSKTPDIEDYDFFHYYKPAHDVGGDYFDYIQLPDGRTAVIVADVVGHGVAAALLMAKLSAEIRFCLATESNPALAITHLNDKFSNLDFEERFVTLIMVVLDPTKHEVTTVSAGHMVPILRKVDGSVEENGEENVCLPLGVLEGMEYEEYVMHLEPGESLSLYTDGLNEAMDIGDQFYTIERLRNLIRKEYGSLTEMGDRIIADVVGHVGERAQYDDMCLVCFQRLK